MPNENVEKLIEMVKEKAYVPGGFTGLTEFKVVDLDDVLRIIQEFIQELED